MEIDASLIVLVQATAEIYGRQISETAARVYLADLSGFSPMDLDKALARCRKELRTFPTVADIVSRMDDGRPGAEEAWAMLPKDESCSVVWTEEMAESFGVVRGMMKSEPIAARMAFREVYTRLVTESRSAGHRVHWFASLGFDRDGREAPLTDALSKKRITLSYVNSVLPSLTSDNDKIRRLIDSGLKGFPE